MVVFVHCQLAEPGVGPVVRAALGDPMRVLGRDRLKTAVGVELFKLVDKVALFAVFFPGEVGQILSLVHVVGYVRLLDGGELKLLPQLGQCVFGNKTHGKLAADGLAQCPDALAQTSIAQRQQIVVSVAKARSFAHK